jgi:hypothetical protein
MRNARNCCASKGAARLRTITLAIVPLAYPGMPQPIAPGKTYQRIPLASHAERHSAPRLPNHARKVGELGMHPILTALSVLV